MSSVFCMGKSIGREIMKAVQPAIVAANPRGLRKMTSATIPAIDGFDGLVVSEPAAKATVFKESTKRMITKAIVILFIVFIPPFSW